MSIDYVALKTELNTDPATLGYAALLAVGDQTSLASVLNFARNGTTPCPVNNIVGAAITVRRSDISVADIYASIDVADYTALPANPNNTQLSTERRFLGWMTGLGGLSSLRLLNDNGSDTPVITNFRAMFASGTPTINRLAALSNRAGSRAEQLFGVNTVVTANDIAAALRS